MHLPWRTSSKPMNGHRPCQNQVLFKRLSPSAVMPLCIHEDDSGYDLICAERKEIPPHAFADVDTHIAIEMPPGIWGMIQGRSSTLRKRGLLVNVGIIDNPYRGSMFVGVWNMTNETVTVDIGDRFAQLLLFPLVKFPWREVNQLSDTERGTGAFGSTGLNMRDRGT